VANPGRWSGLAERFVYIPLVLTSRSGFVTGFHISKTLSDDASMDKFSLTVYLVPDCPSCSVRLSVCFYSNNSTDGLIFVVFHTGDLTKNTEAI